MIRARRIWISCLLGVCACSDPAGDDRANTGGTGASAAGGSASGAGGSSGSGAGSAQGGTVSTGGSGATGGASGSGGSGGGNGGSGGATGGTGGSGAGGSGTGGTGGSGGCDPIRARANRELVGTALDELFVDKDLDAIDRYWGPPYLQHNPIADSGVEAFRSVMSSFVTSPSFSYERLRTLAECDLVVVQGRYSGTGVIFDMFRVEDERIVEHWDSDANQASDASGPTRLLDGQPVAENRARVLAFLDAVLVSDQTARAAEFIAPGHVEHRGSGTGPDAFTQFVTADALTYSTVHHVIADGDFVFTLSEGARGQTAYGFYDLFRLEDGSIVEHWDSRRVVPDSTASGLPIF